MSAVALAVAVAAVAAAVAAVDILARSQHQYSRARRALETR